MIVTESAKAKAVLAGEKVFFNLPVHVELENGASAHLNLAAAIKGVPNPYLITQRDRDLIRFWEHDGEDTFLAGMKVGNRLGPLHYPPPSGLSRLELAAYAHGVNSASGRAPHYQHQTGKPQIFFGFKQHPFF